jgi:hypothetical protein
MEAMPSVGVSAGCIPGHLSSGMRCCEQNVTYAFCCSVCCATILCHCKIIKNVVHDILKRKMTSTYIKKTGSCFRGQDKGNDL